MKPYEQLTEQDIKNIKSNGTGFFAFFLGVVVSVFITLVILHCVYGVI